MSVPWYLMAKGKGGGGYKTASGPIVSVNDALAAPLRSLVANIEPVQDLHGYDSPWPAGGGVNKIVPKDITTTAVGVSIVASSISETIKLSGTATGNGGRTTRLTELTTLQAGTYYFASWGNTPNVALNDSNNAVVAWSGRSFTLESETNVYIGVNLILGTTYTDTIKVALVSGSTAPTAWTPFSNICPISGRTSATVTRTEKNLLDIARLQNWANWDATLVADGDYPTSSGNRAVDLSVKPNTTYTISAGKKETETTWPPFLYLCKYSNGVGARLIYFSDNYKTLTFTTEENTLYYLRMGNSNTQQQFDNSIGKLGWIQLELGSTATPYEPYSGNQYTIQLGQTVYGATLDVTNGVLTVRPYYGSYNGEPLVGPWISSMDAYAPGATPTTGAQVVDLGGTPITIPLTPQEISTLQGQNNVWADSGDVTVEYLSSGGTDPDLMKLAVAFMGRK